MKIIEKVAGLHRAKRLLMAAMKGKKGAAEKGMAAAKKHKVSQLRRLAQKGVYK